MSSWLTRVLSGTAQGETEVVERYTERLLALARSQLPERLGRRLDAEDVVQSVYQSFFRRLRAGEFGFAESHDIWRLLAVMTYCKVRNQVKFHQRARRDVRRETPFPSATSSTLPEDQVPSEEPSPEHLAMLLDSLEQLLGSLPENYRTIIIRRLEGDSIEQIATAVKRSVRTVLRVLAHVQEMTAEQVEGLV
jgi:RNA polymerase sigma-70 factor (ECF subfamily)